MSMLDTKLEITDKNRYIAEYWASTPRFAASIDIDEPACMLCGVFRGDQDFFSDAENNLSELDREKCTEDTSRGLQSQISQGKHVGRIPFGHKIINGNLVHVGCEVTDKINTWFNAGASYREISRKLSELGIKTDRGGAWSHQTVKAILERTNQFFLNAENGLARIDREKCSEDTSAALQHKIAQGEHVGSAPYGSQIENKVLTADAAQAAVIAQIVELRAAGHTLRSIADRLNANNVPTQRGGIWQASTVKKIIDREDKKQTQEKAEAPKKLTWHNSRLQKCHIIPRSLGGTDDADNILLLCQHCHDIMPDINDKELFFKWFDSKDPLFEIKNAFNEAASIVGFDFDALDHLNTAQIMSLVEDVKKKISRHGNQVTKGIKTKKISFALMMTSEIKKMIEENKMLKIKLTPETITLSCDGSSFDTPNEHPQDQMAALNQALMLINHGTEAKVFTEDAKLADLINNIDLRVGQTVRAVWNKDPLVICKAVHDTGLREEGDDSPRDLIVDNDFCVQLALAWEPEELKDLFLPLKYKRRFGLSAELVV